MKNLITVLILFFAYSFANGQKIESYEIEFESKLDTKCSIDLLITYSDSSEIPKKEFVLEKLSEPTKKLLKKYSTIEIYYAKKNEIDSILEKSIIDKFKDSGFNVKETIIGYVNLAEETKILFEQYLQLEQNYLEVELEIHYRKKAIEKELKTNKKLSRIEKKELKKELNVLNNSKYIQMLYDKKMKVIDIKQN
ncbi:MAG: hypothetical protein ACSHW4_15690 [Cellulophaga sp.]